VAIPNFIRAKQLRRNPVVSVVATVPGVMFRAIGANLTIAPKIPYKTIVAVVATAAANMPRVDVVREAR
jgi:hypothetical protein